MKKTKKEKNIGRIYNPVGKFAKRAKTVGYISPICPETLMNGFPPNFAQL